MRKMLSFMMTSADGYHSGPGEALDWHNVDLEFSQFALAQLREAGTLVFGGLVTEAGRTDSYPYYKRLREFGPYVTMPDGSMLVSGYAELTALLREHRIVKAPDGRLVAEGHPDWRPRRAGRGGTAVL